MTLLLLPLIELEVGFEERFSLLRQLLGVPDRVKLQGLQQLPLPLPQLRLLAQGSGVPGALDPLHQLLVSPVPAAGELAAGIVLAQLLQRRPRPLLPQIGAPLQSQPQQ